MMTSIDGFFEGPNKEIDWHIVDDEFNKYAVDFLDTVDTLVFGRITYELMSSYWPTEAGIKDDPLVAERMNKLSKIVYSGTLENVEWNKTKLVRNNIADEIAKQKLKQCKDIAIFGSSDLALTLIPQGLIDEYRIIINPVFIGKGKTLLSGLDYRLNLKLISSKSFRSGNILLLYVPVYDEISKSSFIGDMIN